mgnify:FL=1
MKLFLSLSWRQKADLDHLDSISTALSLSEDEKDLQLIKR